MALVVIGGHSRNIGKTALVVDIIRATPGARWTAVKITQYGHGVCSRNGETCGCAPDEHTVALDEERDALGRSDTSRFLAAGAQRAFWMRTKQGRLAEGMPLLREALGWSPDPAGNAIIESNSLLQFLRPTLYVVVLDPAQPDFKESARRFLDRADALVIRSSTAGTRKAAWPRLPSRLIRSRPHFFQSLGGPLPPGIQALVEVALSCPS